MKDISFSYTNAVSAGTVNALKAQAQHCQALLNDATGKGNDFLGWINLPADIRPQLADIQAVADDLRQRCDVIVCIGIGGSYLGAKAVIDALRNSFDCYDNSATQILYAGQTLAKTTSTNCNNCCKTDSSALFASPNQAPPPNRHSPSDCSKRNSNNR